MLCHWFRDWNFTKKLISKLFLFYHHIDFIGFMLYYQFSIKLVAMDGTRSAHYFWPDNVFPFLLRFTLSAEVPFVSNSTHYFLLNLKTDLIELNINRCDLWHNLPTIRPTQRPTICNKTAKHIVSFALKM